MTHLTPAPLTPAEAELLARAAGIRPGPECPRLDATLPFVNGIRARLWSVALTEADELPAVQPLSPAAGKAGA